MSTIGWVQQTCFAKAGICYNTITERRTGREFGKFIYHISKKYADSKKIILVMDNLNIDKLSSLEKMYGQDKAKEIWDRFEVHYTPQHASWLNQAEIAINMYTRQCLGKARIPDIATLKKKTKAWVHHINRSCVKIL